MAKHHERQTKSGQWSRPDIMGHADEALQRGAQLLAEEVVRQLDEGTPDLEGIETNLFYAAALLRLLWDREEVKEGKK